MEQPSINKIVILLYAAKEANNATYTSNDLDADPGLLTLLRKNNLANPLHCARRLLNEGRRRFSSCVIGCIDGGLEKSRHVAKRRSLLIDALTR